MILKKRKSELKQRVKVSLAKYFGMFCHDCSYNIRFIFTNTKLLIFRTPKNQNIPNRRLSSLKFRFSIEGISNLNCLQGGQEKAGNQVHYRLILETVIRFKIVSIKHIKSIKSRKHETKNMQYTQAT